MDTKGIHFVHTPSANQFHPLNLVYPLNFLIDGSTDFHPWMVTSVLVLVMVLGLILHSVLFVPGLGGGLVLVLGGRDPSNVGLGLLGSDSCGTGSAGSGSCLAGYLMIVGGGSSTLVMVGVC